MSGASTLNVLATADLNRDGWADVAAASSNGNRVAVFLGSAVGPALQPELRHRRSPRGIAVKDLDYDGMLDVITANRSGNTVTVLLGSRSTRDAAGRAAIRRGSRQPHARGGGLRSGRPDRSRDRQPGRDSATLLWNDTAFDTAAFSFCRYRSARRSTIGGSAAVPADFNEDGKLDVVIKPDFTVGRIVQVFLTDGPMSR